MPRSGPRPFPRSISRDYLIMTKTMRAPPAAAGHGPRMSDQPGGSIGSEYTHTPGRNQSSATAHKAKHYCRNLRCRLRLPEPVENAHHAFCTSGCHASFYRSRCLICEERMRRKDERQRCKSGHRLCQSEYRKFPRAYDFPREMGESTGFVRQPPAKAHSTGLKSDVRGDRPTAHCLRGWWWGGDGEHDHSL